MSTEQLFNKFCERTDIPEAVRPAIRSGFYAGSVNTAIRIQDAILAGASIDDINGIVISIASDCLKYSKEI